MIPGVLCFRGKKKKLNGHAKRFYFCSGASRVTIAPVTSVKIGEIAGVHIPSSEAVTDHSSRNSVLYVLKHCVDSFTFVKGVI